MPRFRRLLRWGLLAFAGVSVLGVLALGILYYLISSKLPDVQSLRHVEMQEPMYVYARDGRLMALFGETRRYPIDIAQVPLRQKQAFIAIEDNRFYEHHGVDFNGVARAIWLLATTHDKRVPGGSTITQQVARQFFLSSEYSYTRKLAEMLLAMKMERELSKDEIFQLYLNKSFFGNRAYGIAAAAEFYYGKKLAQLDLDEMATLASIPKFPSSGNPITNPERARIRRDYVLQRMRELGFIDATEQRTSQSVPMHATPHERPIEVSAPYVAEMVRQEMVARYGGDVLTRGYHVTTTIDPVLEAAATQAVRDGLTEYDHRHGWNQVEQHFDLPADETATSASARLRTIPVQGDRIPAVVLRSGEGTADVVLADGTTVTLDAASSRWTGRAPSALVKRGDLVRVRLQQPDDNEANANALRCACTRRAALHARPVAARAIGARVAGARQRRAAGARRRLQLRRQQVQPRDPGQAPAGLELQAVPVRRGIRTRVQPGLDRARRTGRLPRSSRTHLAAAERHRQLRRAHAPARSAGAVAQPGIRAIARCDRSGLRASLYQPFRYRRIAAAAEPVDVAGHRVARPDDDRARLRHVSKWRLPGHAVVHR